MDRRSLTRSTPTTELLSTSPQRLAFYFFDESILDFNFHACIYTEWAMVRFQPARAIVGRSADLGQSQ
jgi:hypothetical protein